MKLLGHYYFYRMLLKHHNQLIYNIIYNFLLTNIFSVYKFNNCNFDML